MHVVLFCIILYYFVLFCIMLYYVVLFCIQCVSFLFCFSLANELRSLGSLPLLPVSRNGGTRNMKIMPSSRRDVTFQRHMGHMGHMGCQGTSTTLISLKSVCLFFFLCVSVYNEIQWSNLVVSRCVYLSPGTLQQLRSGDRG